MARDQNDPKRPFGLKRSTRKAFRKKAGPDKFDRALSELAYLCIANSARGDTRLLLRLFEMYKKAATQENRRKVEKAFHVVAFELHYGGPDGKPATPEEEEE